MSKKIRKDAYPVPAIADLLEKVSLKGADVVSALDLSNFFFQFKLEEGCDVFAFDATHCGLGMLAFKVLPQGVSISSAVAQRALDELLGDLDLNEEHAGIAIYCDDVIIFSSDPHGNERRAVERHYKLLDAV